LSEGSHRGKRKGEEGKAGIGSPCGLTELPVDVRKEWWFGPLSVKGGLWASCRLTERGKPGTP